MIEVMRDLRDKGNTLLVVEHEESVIRAADHLLDIGPGRGAGRAGCLVFAGAVRTSGGGRLADASSLADAGVPDRGEVHPGAEERRPAERAANCACSGAAQNNLRKIDVAIPLGLFCWR